MDIRKQIDFNLKALDTYGDDEIKSALTWFACARDQIVSASTKGDNLYHQVFIALHEMLMGPWTNWPDYD